MEFIKLLEETDDSKKINLETARFLNYEDRGFRIFNQLDMGDLILSIQASCMHYCQPRKTLPLEDYDSMEIAVLNMKGEFVNVFDVIEDKQLAEELNEYYEGSVYSFVPVELIERLYQELKEA